MTTVTINVSKENIRLADMHSPNNCVIQRAMRDSLPLANMIWVGVNQGHMEDLDHSFHGVIIPNEIAKYIQRMMFFEPIIPKYMRWIFFRPFSFQMDVPDQFVAKEPVRSKKIEVTIAPGLHPAEKEVLAV